MRIEVTILIAIIGCALSVGTFFIGRTSAAKTDGKEAGTMQSDLGYVKSGIDDIKAEQREQRKMNTQLFERLTAVEESCKSAHKRLDEIERR